MQFGFLSPVPRSLVCATCVQTNRRVSVTHLLLATTHSVSLFLPPLLLPLFPSSLRESRDKACLSFLPSLSIIIPCRNDILPHQPGSLEGMSRPPSCLRTKTFCSYRHRIFSAKRNQTATFFLYIENLCYALDWNEVTSASCIDGVCLNTACGISYHQKDIKR